MNLYTTIINAVDPKTGELNKYCGPNVPGITFTDAQNYCDNNGLGYCKVHGLLVSEIPCIGKTLIPAWDKEIRYDLPALN